MVYVSPYTHYFDGWDICCRLQRCGHSISTSYCLISHWAFEGLLPLLSCPSAVCCVCAGLAKYRLIKLLNVCGLIYIKTQGDRWTAASSSDEKFKKRKRKKLSVLNQSFLRCLFCLSTCHFLPHTHMHMQTWKLFSWKQTCAQSCYVFGPLFVMLFNYVFFPPVFVERPTHTLCLLLLPSLYHSFCFSVTHPVSFFPHALLTVKLFLDPWATQHCLLLCWMHQTRDE